MQSGRSLEQPAAIGYRAFRSDQHDLSFRIGEAQDKDLGHKGADLLGREIDDGRDLAPLQRLRIVMVGDLGGGFPDPQGCAAIDPELIGRPPRGSVDGDISR